MAEYIKTTMENIKSKDDDGVKGAIGGGLIGGAVAGPAGMIIGGVLGYAVLAKDENILKVHFLNVGDGDCIIVELPDKDQELMMVDICNGNDLDTSLTNPIEYLGDNNKIFRYVQTHPDMDHMDGLYKLKEKCKIIYFWDTKNKKPKPDFNENYSKGIPEDWETYQELRKNANFFTRGTEPISLNEGKFPYNLYVLNPTGDIEKENSDWNLISYVLLLEFKEFKILLGGDATKDTWEDILEWSQSNIKAKKILSNIHIFKTSHHGSKNDYCGNDILKLTNPRHIVISKDNGSVDTAYKDYYNYVGSSDRLWLTSKGNIITTFNGTEVEIKQNGKIDKFDI